MASGPLPNGFFISLDGKSPPRSTPRIASPQALQCLLPQTSAKRRNRTMRLMGCSSSLAKMRSVAGLQWRVAAAEEGFSSIDKRP